MESRNRWVNSFEGLKNFRDVGGGVTVSGEKMKEGILYRSEDLSKLSGVDVRKWSELGIRVIVDLRTERERMRGRSVIEDSTSVRIYHVSMQDESQEYSPWVLLKLLAFQSRGLDFEKMMIKIYHHMAFRSQTEIQKIFSILCQQESFPVLIHCTGGKDRTGFVAAIIQLVMGIPFEKVLDDYLYSNQVMGERMRKMEAFFRWASFFQISKEQVRPLLEVRESYLYDQYKEIIKQYADIETYLIQHCHVKKEQIDSLREVFLIS